MTLPVEPNAAEALLASTFQSMLFGRVPEEDLAPYERETLSTISTAALLRFETRKAGVADIRLSDVALPSGAVITILEAINDDMPFLLASTLAELTERGLTASLVAHPIIAVRRNEDGRLTALGGLAGSAVTADFARESLIHIHLPQIADPEERDSLIATLETIHAEVRLAVRDWQTMRVRLADVARRYRETPPMLPADEIAEAVQFMDWMLADNFSFLGMRAYRFEDDDLAGEPVAGEGLGILSDPSVKVLRRGSEFQTMTPEVRAFLSEPQALIIAKANVRSRIHRRVHMDYVGVKLIDEKGKLEGELRIIGLLTSTAYTGSTRVIPYIRHKVARVMMKAGFDLASHSGKALLNVLENYPRDELFQLDVDTLYAFATDAMSLTERPRVRALIRSDRFDRFVSALIYVPKDRYDTQTRVRIGEYLARMFDGRVSAAYPSYPEGPLARTHYIIGRDSGPTPRIERKVIEAGLIDIITTWRDKLRQTLAGQGGAADQGLVARYGEAFSAAYREAFTPQDSLADIAVLEKLTPAQPVGVDLYRKAGDKGRLASLKLYARGEPLQLSKRVPMLENLGFQVDNERTYRVRAGKGEIDCYLHDMAIERARGGEIDIDAIDERVEETLLAVMAGRVESDHFNTLVTEAGLMTREAMMLRAYGRYLSQIGVPFSLDSMADALAKYPAITAGLVALFRLRFDPRREEDRAARLAASAELAAKIRRLFETVTNLDEDRIFRRYLNLIEATVRTNYYQSSADGADRPTLCFKFDCKAVEGLPLPKPLFEIFVHSARVDGVHLRFGKVARGGIRWSDRAADFRTEILGLVKAQQVKNAVIVPVGAKGGFYPKRLPPASDREAWLKEGTESYKLFIGSLLDVTDNLNGSAIVPPADVVRLDGDDPYLVVAADKGTATFSDTANAISLQRGHWLGDAFASGGSQGYDHKKMGITARGAWECVRRHFREIDIDIQKEPFTVAGVGDMSGDVFGNGMLLSPAIKLVAAFDHRDIFLDPAPDPAQSLAERQRLFALPRSSWQDYDKGLISAGGGVFSRSAKEIPLSPEVQALLGLAAETATPAEVMTAILKAKVDLLWFGGIGTYIRASDETDQQAGDRANDAIRITGSDVHARVIGEGANLGCTQRGRIEAAKRGVKLNTDAIDNSAGVNTSDVEVNLKIALATPVGDGRLTDEARNTLLASMTDDVAALVLRNNYLQSLAISLSERKGAAGLFHLQQLMQGLEARGRLDRGVEYLPGDAEIARRMAAGESATRPELAVLLAYAKLAFFDDLIGSKTPDDPYFADELDRYFPSEVREAFPDAVQGHRLRREIIATQLSNIVVNRCGPGAIARFADETGADTAAIAAAYALTRDSFGLLDLNGAIDALDALVGGDTQLDLYAAVQDMIVTRMSWFLRNVDLSQGIGPEVKRFRTGIEAARTSMETLLPAAMKDDLRRRFSGWVGRGTPDKIAARVVELPALEAAPDAVLVAEQTGTSVAEALSTLYTLSEKFAVARIKAASAGIRTADRFERLAVDRAVDGLDLSLRRLAADILARYGAGAEGLEKFEAARGRDVARITATIADIVAGGLTQAKLTVAANMVGDLARG
jgi:glutamate dehydrogenase